MKYIIKKIMPAVSGVSQSTGTAWTMQEFVAEEVADVQYPNQLLLRLSGERMRLLQGVAEGDVVELGYNSLVREFTTQGGRAVASQQNNCWRLERVDQQTENPNGGGMYYGR